MFGLNEKKFLKQIQSSENLIDRWGFPTPFKGRDRNVPSIVWLPVEICTDQYVETHDIIFFPRMMTLEKKEEKILRAGIKIPATTKEKTYRLFIEEIPGPRKAEGVNVAIAIRFGVPIFVKPFKDDAKGVIEKIELSKGVLNVHVKNAGNVHLIIHSVNIK